MVKLNAAAGQLHQTQCVCSSCGQVGDIVHSAGWAAEHKFYATEVTIGYTCCRCGEVTHVTSSFDCPTKEYCSAWNLAMSLPQTKEVTC